MCFPENRTLTEIEESLESFADKTPIVYDCLQIIATSSFDVDKMETTYQLKDEYLEEVSVFNGVYSLMEQNERINVPLRSSIHP
jgi:hypothetical protein